jgi:protein-S-isoprenylcysteine O-methyltransferase Ste14
MSKQTAHKAHIAAAVTLIATVLAVFGVGATPAFETVADAAAMIGGALVLSGLSWLATWAIPNRNKERRR